MRQWMIRHPDFTFTRPISEAEVIAKIESGEVTARDEIAASNGFWFSIQEIDEVKNHFGDSIHLQALMPIGNDQTSATNTALIGNKTTNPTRVRAPAPSSEQAPAFTAAARSKTERKVQTYQPAEFEESEASSSSKPRMVFGLILIAIFLGTLSLLWLGSR